MNYTTLALTASSLATLLVCLALAREVRLRRALQNLLARLLAHWRKPHVPKPNVSEK